jgi:hypothetical protein
MAVLRMDAVPPVQTPPPAPRPPAATACPGGALGRVKGDGASCDHDDRRGPGSTGGWTPHRCEAAPRPLPPSPPGPVVRQRAVLDGDDTPEVVRDAAPPPRGRRRPAWLWDRCADRGDAAPELGVGFPARCEPAASPRKMRAVLSPPTARLGGASRCQGQTTGPPEKAPAPFLTRPCRYPRTGARCWLPLPPGPLCSNVLSVTVASATFNKARRADADVADAAGAGVIGTPMAWLFVKVLRLRKPPHVRLLMPRRWQAQSVLLPVLGPAIA